MSAALLLAFQALAANKLRAALTMLGTVIGVTCVVAIWNIGESGRHFMGDSLASIGQNIIVAFPRYSGDEESQRRYRYKPLSLADAAAVEAGCPSVKEVSPVLFGSCKAIFGTRFRNTEVRGCFPPFFSIEMWNFEAGAAFSAADVDSSNRVVVLGASVAKELFGELAAVGQVIRLDREPFTVIGVLKPKGSFFGQKRDDVILAPFSSVADHMGWGRQVHGLFISARSRELIPQAKNEIRLAVRQSQKLPPERRDAIELQDLGEVAKSVDQVLVGITMLLGAIGAISLLVGGIGIMNIMLVSVTERTREIGLRMALGATDVNVLTQFLVEAMALSGVGGLLGAGVGLGAAAGAVKVLSATTGKPWPLVLSPGSVVAAFIFALGVGVFFGFYPAWRASRLNPIVALRHE